MASVVIGVLKKERDSSVHGAVCNQEQSSSQKSHQPMAPCKQNSWPCLWSRVGSTAWKGGSQGASSPQRELGPARGKSALCHSKKSLVEEAAPDAAEEPSQAAGMGREEPYRQACSLRPQSLQRVRTVLRQMKTVS